MAGGMAFSSSPYRPSRVDANQKDVVDAFRKLGYSVHCTHTVGNGFPDLVVGKWFMNWLVEVKDGEKNFSARQFKDSQRKFHFSWSGHKCVITNLAEVHEFDRQVRAIIKKLKKHNINWNILGCQDIIYQPSLY